MATSSCDCCNVNPMQKIPDIGVPTNMSVRNCNFQPYKCFNEYPLKTDIEPADKSGYTLLNPDHFSKMYDKSFTKTKVNCPTKGCEEVYYSPDPRLISVPHSGQVLPLDRPPITAEIKLDTIYNPELTNYGKNYGTYTDINAGQILYYIDKSREDPFYEPLFSKEARMLNTLYRDPMNAMKPQYDRCPIEPCNNPLMNKDKEYFGKLSWIDDSTEHREDILARQMRKRNEQRWEPRWV